MTTSPTYKNKTILEEIMAVDQQAIADFKAGKITSADLTSINNNNVNIVKKIITEQGFPTIHTTSQKAYKAAVLVVLHSGDIDLLNKCIDYLRKAEDASVEKRDIAFMIDKTRVIQNLPQLYGTQYGIENGNIKFIDIENPNDLEKRREAIGMESFEEYKKTIATL